MDEKFLPVPCPSNSAIDFRGYFRGENSGRLAVTDGSEIRYCTQRELDYLENSARHDAIAPWEKTFMFGADGLAQVRTETMVSGK